MVLKHIYKNFDGICAVQDISFSLDASQVVGLVGDNGAGKSTLIKMISGRYQPASGEILVNDTKVEISSPVKARELGIEVVHQDLALCGNLRAYENIFLGREESLFRSIWSPLRKKSMQFRAQELLDRLQSDTDANRFTAGMSGGQRQAVAIARTLLSDSQLVILDEPLAAISIRQVQQVLDLIRRIKDEGKSVLLITHRLDDVFAVCDRILVMRRGQLVADRKADDFTVNELTGFITGASS
jgi:simple sugar transport system ATP-binding protein